MSLPKVSIVISNAKDTYYIQKLLNSMKKTNYPNYEIIIIDCITKGFTDWMSKVKENIHLPLRYIHYSKDIGASAERNKALDLVDNKAKYIIFLDNDTEIVDKNWITTLVKAMEDNPEICALSPVIVNMGDVNSIQSAGCYLYPHLATYNISDIREIPEKEIYESFHFHGAAFIIRKKVLDELKKFNLNMYMPFFFIGFDDIELSIRLRARGYKIFFTKKTKIVHKKGGITRHISKFRIFHAWKNTLCTFLFTYSNVVNIIKLYPYIVIRQIFFLIRNYRNPTLCFYILRAYLWVLKNLKKILKIRKKIKRYRILSDKDILLIMGLLLIKNRIKLMSLEKKYRHYVWSIVNHMMPKE